MGVCCERANAGVTWEHRVGHRGLLGTAPRKVTSTLGGEEGSKLDEMRGWALEKRAFQGREHSTWEDLEA